MSEPVSVDDVADQLASEVEQWFTNIAKSGEIPRVRAQGKARQGKAVPAQWPA
jgi:hypothetical protein